MIVADATPASTKNAPAPGATGDEGETTNTTKEIQMNEAIVTPTPDVEKIVTTWLNQIPSLNDGDPRRDKVIESLAGTPSGCLERSDQEWGAWWMALTHQPLSWPVAGPQWATETDVRVEADRSGNVQWAGDAIGAGDVSVWLVRYDYIHMDPVEYNEGSIEIAVNDNEGTTYFTLEEVDVLYQALAKALRTARG